MSRTRIRTWRGACERTAFDRTPFGILGATTRDSRHRIVELADEKSLIGDAEGCSRARAELTNPRTRIAAEVAWFPGLSPARAESYCSLLKHDLDALLAAARGESPLVRANMIAAAIERFDPSTVELGWLIWVPELAAAAQDVDVDTVLQQLNEDRIVARFPAITMREFVEAELIGRRRVYRETIKDALDRMPTETIVQVVGGVVDICTETGTQPAPILVDEVVEVFEAEAQQFLVKEGENVRQLLEAIKGSASESEAGVGRLVDGLERVVRNWSHVAGPMKMTMQARGVEHPASRDLAREIRGLGVDLANKHGLFQIAQRITDLLRSEFGELFEVAEVLERDSTALEEIVEEQRSAKEKREQWAREIEYEAELGLFLTDTLRLSAAGIEWKGSSYPLEAITRVGWGATKHSLNGIPTGTTYKLFFGDKERVSEVELSQDGVFGEFVDRLWKAVGVRLVTQLLNGLREGQRYRFDAVLVDDCGVELPRRRLFKATERVYAAWDKVHVWVADGSFWIGLKGDNKTSAALPYQEANNAHILEAAIRAGFKKGADRLSEILG